jgi:hypothetical protein
LACVDGGHVLRFALEHKAAAIIHGHKHMPYLRRYRQQDREVTVISCGSALYQAHGPCAQAIGGPSCLGLHIEGGRLVDVHFVTAASLAEARRADARRSSP